MSGQTDKDVIIKVRNGQIEQFSYIVKKYTQKIFKFINTRLYDKSETDDLVQNVFISFYKSIGKFDYSKKVLPYLYEIAKNELKMYFRSHKVNLPLKEEIVVGDVYLNNNLDTEILKNLKSDERKLLLEIANGFSYKELSKKYKITLNNIKSKIRRTRLKLRKFIYETT